MIIMSLDASKTKSPLTTSVAVLIFASILSLTLQMANDQMLAATAGYAGVLMVFCGVDFVMGWLDSWGFYEYLA